MNLKDFLTSTHEFDLHETDLFFKFRVLNYFMVIAIIFSFLVAVLGFLDIMKIGRLQSVADLAYGCVNIFLLWYLRQDKAHFHQVVWSSMIATLMLFIMAFLNVSTDEARVVWLYIAVYIAYMLLGTRTGILFTVISILTIVIAHIFTDLQISDTAIGTFLFALIVLSLLARAHDQHVNEYRKKLKEQYVKLEKNISEMDSALAEARSANQVKSLFLANMSHEIRTPMNGVLSMVQVLENTRLDGQQKNYLKAIKRSGDSLLILIDDLLDLSKIESGTFSLNPRNFKTWDIIEDILDQVEPLFDQSNSHFSTDIKEGLPASLYGDASRLKQVVLNLIANAAKFTPQGEVVLHINGDYETEGYHLIIEVEDSGIGIAKDKQKTIFEVFQQLSADRIANKGVGLGLAICHEIIGKMQGTISLTSSEGKGSCFRIDITMPVIELSEKREEKNISVIPDKLKLLVCEDDNISRYAVKALLSGHGHSVETVENGEEGVRMLEKESFDIVLMDIHMPVLNGVDATRIIKQKKLTAAPIIGMTASVMNDEKENYFKAGIDALVEKPIQFASLMEVINKQLRKEK